MESRTWVATMTESLPQLKLSGTTTPQSPPTNFTTELQVNLDTIKDIIKVTCVLYRRLIALSWANMEDQSH